MVGSKNLMPVTVAAMVEVVVVAVVGRVGWDRVGCCVFT